MSLYMKDLLRMAEQRFEESQCPDPKLDAELLMCHFLQRDSSYLFLHYGDAMEDRHCQGYLDMVDRRASGIPLQYITGVQEFMGLEFMVNEHVLIPRQDTEELVETALMLLEAQKTPMGGFEILDLCCGSGAIGISLVRKLEEKKIKVKMTASDISGEALAVAKENARKNGADRIQFEEGDLFAPFPKDKKGFGKKRFDLIITNPPYIPSEVIPTLQREVRDHEPLLALDGGETGLDFYRRILPEALFYLKPEGLLLMEIGWNQGADLIRMGQEGDWDKVGVKKDLSGNDRVCVLQAYGKKKKPEKEKREKEAEKDTGREE